VERILYEGDQGRGSHIFVAFRTMRNEGVRRKWGLDMVVVAREGGGGKHLVSESDLGLLVLLDSSLKECDPTSIGVRLSRHLERL
jgi:hypothetical protein